MKHLLIISAVILSFSFTPQSSCGDGNLYSVKKQTKNDRRFNQYEKIKRGPKFTGGDLDEFIDKNLKLSEVAKTQIFVLNYQFTVTCDGKLKDIKPLGAKQAANWTNIVEIIKKTEGQWEPAKKKKEAVDCIYFGRKWIN